MKVEFVVSPTIKINEGGVGVQTDMLVLTKIEGLALGTGPRAVDAAMDGAIMKRIEEKQFRGALKQSVVVTQPGALQKHVVVVGLGRVSTFDPCTLKDVIEVVLRKAIKHGCTRITVPIVANRLTSLNLNLRGSAHIIRVAAERYLAQREEEGTIQLEILCTAQAKRHVDEGLAIPCAQPSDCCQDGKERRCR